MEQFADISVDRVNIQMEAEDADRTEIWHYLKKERENESEN